MICSLNQIEQTARKAARGGGAPWGLADEVGKALRWLHAYRFNGAAALAARLEDAALAVPASLRGAWHADSSDRAAALDPLAVGASLSDCFDRDRAFAIDTAAIAHPLLAAGFVIVLAQIEGCAFALHWRGATLHCRRGGIRAEGALRAIETARAEAMQCRRQDAAGSRDWRAPRIGEVEVADAAWRRLERYAARTYVEATAASRLAGAGAGLTDND